MPWDAQDFAKYQEIFKVKLERERSNHDIQNKEHSRWRKTARVKFLKWEQT